MKRILIALLSAMALLVGLVSVPVSAAAAAPAIVPSTLAPVVFLSTSGNTAAVVSTSSGVVQRVDLDFPNGSVVFKTDPKTGSEAYLSTAAVQQIATVYGLKTVVSPSGDVIAVVSVDGAKASIAVAGFPSAIQIQNGELSPFNFANAPYVSGSVVYWPIEYVASWLGVANIGLTWMVYPTGGAVIWPYTIPPQSQEGKG